MKKKKQFQAAALVLSLVMTAQVNAAGPRPLSADEMDRVTAGAVEFVAADVAPTKLLTINPISAAFHENVLATALAPAPKVALVPLPERLPELALDPIPDITLPPRIPLPPREEEATDELLQRLHLTDESQRHLQAVNLINEVGAVTAIGSNFAAQLHGPDWWTIDNGPGAAKLTQENTLHQTHHAKPASRSTDEFEFAERKLSSSRLNSRMEQSSRADNDSSARNTHDIDIHSEGASGGCTSGFLGIGAGCDMSGGSLDHEESSTSQQTNSSHSQQQSASSSAKENTNSATRLESRRTTREVGGTALMTIDETAQTDMRVVNLINAVHGIAGIGINVAAMGAGFQTPEAPFSVPGGEYLQTNTITQNLVKGGS